MRNLPDYSPAEAESPPVPQPVEEEEAVVEEENPTEIQNLPEAFNASSSGLVGSDSRTHSGGIGSGSADSTNPITTGMKTGKKGGKGKEGGMQYWNALKGKEGEFEERKDLVSWDVKAVVDSIDSSKEAIINLQTKLGGLEKNVELHKIVFSKMARDITNLLGKLDVGGSEPDRLKKTLDKTLGILGINPKEFDEYQNRAYDDDDDDDLNRPFTVVNPDWDIPYNPAGPNFGEEPPPEIIPKPIPLPPWIERPRPQDPNDPPTSYPSKPGGEVCPECAVPGYWLWIHGEWQWQYPIPDGGLSPTMPIPSLPGLGWKIGQWIGELYWWG